MPSRSASWSSDVASYPRDANDSSAASRMRSAVLALTYRMVETLLPSPPMPSGAAVPFPIIVGCPRSGTTLVRNFLDTHPDMAVPPESHFLVALAGQRSRWERPDGGTVDVDGLLDWLLAGERFRAWGLDETVVRA